MSDAFSIGAVLVSAAMSAFVTYKVTSRSIRAAGDEGTRQRDHDSSERTLDREHEKLLLREQLVHRTRREAYVTIQQYLSFWEKFAIAHSTRFVISPDPSDEEAPVIGHEAEAIANLMASDSVNAAVKDVQQHLYTLELELQTARDFEASIPMGVADARQQMANAQARARVAATEAAAAIDGARELMRAELLTGTTPILPDS